MPNCVKESKGRERKYKGGPTAYSKLADFLERWQEAEIPVAVLRGQLGISESVWHDLMKDKRVKALFARLNITREGRGKHTKLVRHDTDAA